jgi:FlaG/FlaF family flagellin (archaellin)
VTVIVEGKKYGALFQDCRAVSEVIGQVLMVAVVVLAFSSIAITVFSVGGAVNPPHVPRTDLQESVNFKDNTVQVFHSGGEAIDLKDIRIILSADGQHKEFDISDTKNVTVFDPAGNETYSDGVFMLGDCIVINPGNVNVTGGNATLYFIHTASSQVIKKAML